MIPSIYLDLTVDQGFMIATAYGFEIQSLPKVDMQNCEGSMG
jgi:hypothetical protein